MANDGRVAAAGPRKSVDAVSASMAESARALEPTRLIDGPREWLVFLAAWIPYGVVWFLLGLDDRSLGRAFAGALIHYAGTVTGAGAVVLWIGSLNWPVPWSAGFFARQIAAALAFSAWVMSIDLAFASLWTGVSFAELPFRTRAVVPWNLTVELSVYVFVAATAFAFKAARCARQTEEALLRQTIAAETARLAALRHQLQPHFLFNALHSVSALVTRSPEAAERALEQIASILRYSLRSADTAPLADEWQCLRDYLTLEQLRYGDALKLELLLDDNAATVPVPLFTVQALAENAIRHGLAARPELGTLRIRAEIASGCLLIRADDDGVGSEARTQGESHGTGLASLRTRLRLLCGAEASLELSRSASGSHAIVSIPVQAARPT